MGKKPSVSMPDELYKRVEQGTGPNFSKRAQNLLSRGLIVEEYEQKYDGKLPDGWLEDAIEEYFSSRSALVSGLEAN